jgi:hypothetical protein
MLTVDLDPIKYGLAKSFRQPACYLQSRDETQSGLECFRSTGGIVPKPPFPPTEPIVNELRNLGGNAGIRHSKRLQPYALPLSSSQSAAAQQNALHNVVRKVSHTTGFESTTQILSKD